MAMTGMAVKGKEKQVIAPSVYQKLESSLGENSSMSYCEIAYDGRYDVLLQRSPFTIWCVNTACFLGEGTEDERRSPQKNIEQSSQSEQILIIAT